MALPRPIKAEYYNGKNRVFKKGSSSTVERAIVAAIRTLTEQPQRNVRVYIYNGRGYEKAHVCTPLRSSQSITVKRYR
jgi:hypothetical protein